MTANVTNRVFIKWILFHMNVVQCVCVCAVSYYHTLVHVPEKVQVKDASLKEHNKSHYTQK